MPWKECQVEDERLRFVARLLDGEKMARLCAEFGISRKTGYKIFERYKDVGLQGLTDRSRRPYRHANQLPLVIETTIVRLKREYPHWGAPKIRERLAAALSRRPVPGDQHRARGPRPAWPGDAAEATPVSRGGHRPVAGDHAQRPVVRRLQRRVHARRPALLLPAHHHRLRDAAT